MANGGKGNAAQDRSQGIYTSHLADPQSRCAFSDIFLAGLHAILEALFATAALCALQKYLGSRRVAEYRYLTKASKAVRNMSHSPAAALSKLMCHLQGHVQQCAHDIHEPSMSISFCGRRPGVPYGCSWSATWISWEGTVSYGRTCSVCKTSKEFRWCATAGGEGAAEAAGLDRSPLLSVML